jgi:1-acyl-sn-glycerol-3-phosphate acyltransferase
LKEAGVLDTIPNCLNRKPFYTKYTRRLFEAFARLVFRFYCPLEVSGSGNLPTGPFILCSNHASHMDSIALMAASSHGFDRFGLLAASDYFFRSPLVYRCFSSMVNLIPIGRTRGAESFHHTLTLCRHFIEPEGRILIVFPEGTRSPNGAIGPFKPGVGILSDRLGIPVVPAYIHGTREAMPKGRLFPAHRRVVVRIGVPIYPHANGGVGRNHQWLAAQARSRIEDMRGDAASAR